MRGSSGSLGGGAIVNQGTILADDSGGSVPGFSYDIATSGSSSTGNTAAAIDTAGVSDPAPQAVYQTYRTGTDFTYTLGGLTPGANYTAELLFAEPTYNYAGLREFNVTINGTQVLTHFDIAAAAGGMNKAVHEQFAATADGSGQITIEFSWWQGSAVVNGIKLLASDGSVVQGINCGQTVGGTIAVDPTVFTNQGDLQAASTGTLSVGSLAGSLGTASVSGTGSTLSISGTNWVNNLPLAAPAGVTLVLGGTWTNDSTITASGAVLQLGDPSASSMNEWNNAGVIDASDSTVNLGGSFVMTDLGTFDHADTTVNLVGTLNNQGQSLTLNATTGSWDLAGGILLGGTLDESDGAELVFTSSGGKLDGVTAQSDLDLTANYNAYVDIVDGLTLDGITAYLGNASGSTCGRMVFDQTETLGGTGAIVFGAWYYSDNYLSDYHNAIFGAPGATLTIGSGITMHGTSGVLGRYAGGDTIINQGTILADGSGTITIHPGAFTNQGILGANNGGTLSVRGVWTNAATITATGGGTLDLGDQSASSTNAWTNTGTITATDSTINLGGLLTLAALGTLSRPDTMMNLTGTLLNAGGTFALDAATGSWNLAGGTLRGGNLTETEGAELVFTAAGGMLDGVTADNDLDLAANAGANVHVVNGLTLSNVTVWLGNSAGTTYGRIYFDSTETLGGTGSRHVRHERRKCDRRVQ